jgi:hypothetical protein
VLLLNLFPLIPFYILGLILLIALLSSVPYALIVIPQSFALHLTLTRLMLTPSSTLPSAVNPFALLTTLMVVTNELSSYLLILSLSSP